MIETIASNPSFAGALSKDFSYGFASASYQIEVSPVERKHEWIDMLILLPHIFVREDIKTTAGVLLSGTNTSRTKRTGTRPSTRTTSSGRTSSSSSSTEPTRTGSPSRGPESNLWEEKMIR